MWKCSCCPRSKGMLHQARGRPPYAGQHVLVVLNKASSLNLRHQTSVPHAPPEAEGLAVIHELTRVHQASQRLVRGLDRDPRTLLHAQQGWVRSALALLCVNSVKPPPPFCEPVVCLPTDAPPTNRWPVQMMPSGSSSSLSKNAT